MRIKLADRKLPDYTRGEEIFNMVTHIVGGGLSIGVNRDASDADIKSALAHSGYGVVSSAIYGACMVLLYCMSSVYHGLPASTGKKVLQILDHCAIYFMIAGTYMPIMLCALRPLYPGLAWTVFGLQWALTALAVTFTAIDLKQYAALSMVCYILMGWCVIFFVRPIIQVMTMAGFWLLLFGGLSYTLGAILYGIGSKKPYFHSAFHVFVLLGSGFQFWAIYAYALPG